jgi:hypothetical protein
LNATGGTFGASRPKKTQSRSRSDCNQHPVFNQKIHKKPLKSSHAAHLRAARQIRILKWRTETRIVLSD